MHDFCDRTLKHTHFNGNEITQFYVLIKNLVIKSMEPMIMEENTEKIQKPGVTDISWIIIDPRSNYQTESFDIEGVPNIKWCIKYRAPDHESMCFGNMEAFYSRFKLKGNHVSDSKHDSEKKIKVELVIGSSKTVSRFMEITNSLKNFRKIITHKDLEKYLNPDKSLNLRLVTEILETERKHDDEMTPTNFDSYLINDALSDVILQINNVNIPAHKIVLASASPVFRKMFSHQMLENVTNIVQIKNVDLDVFKEMLRFIYSGQIYDLGTLAFGLYDIAHEYDIKRLQIICEEFLQESLTINNVVPILELADRHNSLNLKRKCIEYIDQHFDKLGKTKDLQNVNRDLLLELIYSKYSNSSNDDKKMDDN